MLDDAVWQKAPRRSTSSRSRNRAKGAPATERTEVRVHVRQPAACYIGVHAFDAQPSAIVATEMRRDSDRLLDEDNFQIILDTFNDSRNGYMFVTTPLGAKLEQQISEEGEGNSRAGLVNSNINRNWDGVWDVGRARSPTTAGPPRSRSRSTTLRFADGDEQTWGINFMRNIRRKNEQVFWAPIPKAYTPDARQPGRRARRPAVAQPRPRPQAQAVRRQRRARHRSDRRRAAARRRCCATSALDAKYGVTGGLNLDVTYNTDFAQVEVDEQQVNLTRFSLFFPEKRDFFLENAGLFKMGTGGTFTSTHGRDRSVLQPPHRPVRYRARRFRSSAARAWPARSGRHNIGVLDIQTDSAFGRPGDNFLVGRYSSDVLKRSRVGAHLHQQGDDGRRRALQPHDGRRREPGARQEPAGQLVRREDRRRPGWTATTWRSSAASRIAIPRGTSG